MATKTAEPKTATKPFFRFTHSKPLRTKTLKVLDAIDTEADPTPHRDELSAIINELTETGMTFFFLDPMEKLKLGFILNQSASMGVAGVLSIMGSTVRKIVGRLDEKQLRQVSKIMREMMQ